MPIRFELDHKARLVRDRAEGILEAEELLELIGTHRELFAAGTLDDSWAEIADFSRVDEVRRITPKNIERFCDANPWPPDALRTLITPTDLLYGLARMYQLTGGDRTRNVHIARSASEALDWIIHNRDMRRKRD